MVTLRVIENLTCYVARSNEGDVSNTVPSDRHWSDLCRPCGTSDTHTSTSNDRSPTHSSHAPIGFVLHGRTHAVWAHEVWSVGAPDTLHTTHALSDVETLEGLSERSANALHTREVALVLVSYGGKDEQWWRVSEWERGREGGGEREGGRGRGRMLLLTIIIGWLHMDSSAL